MAYRSLLWPLPPAQPSVDRATGTGPGWVTGSEGGPRSSFHPSVPDLLGTERLSWLIWGECRYPAM